MCVFVIQSFCLNDKVKNDEKHLRVTRCVNLKYGKVQMESLPRSLDYKYEIYLLWPMDRKYSIGWSHR